MSDWTRADVPRLDDRVIVVTGANSGIGRAATALFARNGARVVMACRRTLRGKQAAAAIREEEPVDGDALDVRECDLADLRSVERFASDVRETYDAVDALCNNAGVMAVPRRETEQGFESQLGINHLGHFALTGHLLPALAAGDDPRVVTQSSSAHRTGSMAFDDLNWEESYGKWRAYGRSKLANLLFAYELDRRLADHAVGVRSLACHPGYAGTNLQLRTARESRVPGYETVMRLANRLIAQSAADGALPMAYAATADVPGGSYVGPSGFLDARGPPELQESSDDSFDERDAERFWAWSVEATGVEFPFDALARTAP